MIILCIIGTGIVIGSWAFFGKEYDFRSADANLLNYKIKNCLTKNFDFSIEKTNFEKYFFQKCNLNETIIKDYYLIGIYLDSAVLYDYDAAHNLCPFSEKNPTYPKCVEKEFKIKIEDKEVKLRILTGSSQIRR